MFVRSIVGRVDSSEEIHGTTSNLVRQENQKRFSGDGLRSHRATPAVSSALAGLTTGFEMGPGVPPPL